MIRQAGDAQGAARAWPKVGLARMRKPVCPRKTKRHTLLIALQRPWGVLVPLIVGQDPSNLLACRGERCSLYHSSDLR